MHVTHDNPAPPFEYSKDGEAWEAANTNTVTFNDPNITQGTCYLDGDLSTSQVYSLNSFIAYTTEGWHTLTAVTDFGCQQTCYINMPPPVLEMEPDWEEIPSPLCPGENGQVEIDVKTAYAVPYQYKIDQGI